MVPVYAGLFTYLATAGGALLGLWASSRLPDHHLGDETSRSVSVGMALVGTLSALVLGLLVNSASASFNKQTEAIEAIAIDALKLDRLLRAYDPTTARIRENLAGYVRAKVDEVSQPNGDRDAGLETLRLLESVSDAIMRLTPETSREKALHARAIQLVNQIEDSRWRLFQRAQMVMPTSVLAMLVAWLSLLFASFGLFSPRNGTAIAFLMLSAAALSGSIFIILELGSPSGGFIHPSAEPLSRVLDLMCDRQVSPESRPASICRL